MADMACHQIQSVEMKSIQAYGICKFVRSGGNLFLCVLISRPWTFVTFFLVKYMYYHCNALFFIFHVLPHQWGISLYR